VDGVACLLSYLQALEDLTDWLRMHLQQPFLASSSNSRQRGQPKGESTGAIVGKGRGEGGGNKEGGGRGGGGGREGGGGGGGMDSEGMTLENVNAESVNAESVNDESVNDESVNAERWEHKVDRVYHTLVSAQPLNEGPLHSFLLSHLPSFALTSRAARQNVDIKGGGGGSRGEEHRSEGREDGGEAGESSESGEQDFELLPGMLGSLRGLMHSDRGMGSAGAMGEGGGGGVKSLFWELCSEVLNEVLLSLSSVFVFVL